MRDFVDTRLHKDWARWRVLWNHGKRLWLLIFLSKGRCLKAKNYTQQEHYLARKDLCWHHRSSRLWSQVEHSTQKLWQHTRLVLLGGENWLRKNYSPVRALHRHHCPQVWSLDIFFSYCLHWWQYWRAVHLWSGRLRDSTGLWAACRCIWPECVLRNCRWHE